MNLGYSKLDLKYGEVEPPDGGSTSSYFSIDQTTGKVTPLEQALTGQAAAFTAGLDLHPVRSQTPEASADPLADRTSNGAKGNSFTPTPNAD